MKMPLLQETAELADDNLLHMGGSQESRLRTEQLSSKMDSVIVSVPDLIGVRFPILNKELDLNERIRMLLKKEGFDGLESAVKGLQLPDCRLMAVHSSNQQANRVRLSFREELRNALILGKTGMLLYDPLLPPVFTRRRLERELDYITINTRDFYELD